MTLRVRAVTHFVYGRQGQLMGEYTSAGAAVQETIYLGDTPVGMWKANRRYYIQPDHLNTARAILDQTNRVVWLWKSDPFGTTNPTADPDGDSKAFAYNLRFPGQYFDQETGQFYNYFRDYDPRTGRYVQSDPIGLGGGLNSYVYADSSPMMEIDPTGQVPFFVIPGLCAGGGCEAIGVSIAVWWAAHNSTNIDSPTDLPTDDGSCSDNNRNPSQDKKLTPGEIKKLKEGGYDPEELKGGKKTGQWDLFKDKKCQ